MSKKKNKIALIGVGPHAKRIYLPFLKSLNDDCDLKYVYEVESKYKQTRKTLDDFGFKNIKIITVKESNKSFKLTNTEKKGFRKICKEVDSIIIASEPFSHKAYIIESIKNKKNILCDKPLTLYNGIIKKESNKKILIKDYNKIFKLFKKKQTENKFSCMAQRRYHPAVNFILKEIDYVFEKTNVLPNSIFIQHSDGQLRTQEEIKQIKYHGFNQGYGKIGHSGYHFFDIAGLYATNNLKNVSFNKISCNSNLFLAKDYINFLNKSKLNYKRIYEDVNKCGETDAFVNYKLLNNSNYKCNIQVNLLHNSLSSRHWLKSNDDLYKKNGRLRHETHIINIGPFCTIYYFSYQGKEFLKKKYSTDLGSEGHSEVVIFRNRKLLKTNKKSIEKINFGEHNITDKYSRGHQEESRFKCFKEFIFSKGDGISSIEKHKLTVNLLSLAYQSSNKVKIINYA